MKLGIKLIVLTVVVIFAVTFLSGIKESIVRHHAWMIPGASVF